PRHSHQGTAKWLAIRPQYVRPQPGKFGLCHALLRHLRAKIKLVVSKHYSVYTQAIEQCHHLSPLEQCRHEGGREEIAVDRGEMVGGSGTFSTQECHQLRQSPLALHGGDFVDVVHGQERQRGTLTKSRCCAEHDDDDQSCNADGVSRPGDTTHVYPLVISRLCPKTSTRGFYRVRGNIYAGFT